MTPTQSRILCTNDFKAREKSRAFIFAAVASTLSAPAWAELTEATNTATWVVNIFSPGLMLALLTILLIGTGIAVWLGKMRAQLWIVILVGSVLVFGSRTIGPKLMALF